MPDSGIKGVYLARPDGSIPGADAQFRYIFATDVPGDHRQPRWSPDGQRVAFSVQDGDTPREIWIADADGTDAARLFNLELHCPSGASHPSWSPDGSQLAIICDTTVNNLAIVDVASGDLRIVTSIRYPEFVDNPASWSPDGMTLAFDIAHEFGDQGKFDGWLIATIPTSGGEIRRLTDFDFFGARPDWHPTDELIAFNRYDLGNLANIRDASQPSDVYTIRPDGSGLRQVTTASTESLRITQPRWAPDGSKLLVTVAGGNPVNSVEIGFVDPATGSLTFPESRFFGTRPDLRPTP